MSATPNKPCLPTRLIVVMGVSGSGKSTVAEALAEQLGYCYLDADDFHSDEAKACMAAGTPLTDAQRAPWVHNICAHLAQCAKKEQSCTLAFSGLRRSHREQLRRLPFQVIFLYLDGSQALIARRMSQRCDHFMPTSLLDSQFASMESSDDEADVIPIDISQTPQGVLERCLTSLASPNPTA